VKLDRECRSIIGIFETMPIKALSHRREAFVFAAQRSNRLFDQV
jgi:hypothetical protein